MAERPPDWLRIYRIHSGGQPTGGDPPSWGLEEVLTINLCKILRCYEIFHKASDLDWFFGTMWVRIELGGRACERGSQHSNSVQFGEFDSLTTG